MLVIYLHLYRFLKRSGDGSRLLVDENKDFCVCPITEKVQGEVSGILCNCSEKFAEQMFSKVCQKR